MSYLSEYPTQDSFSQKRVLEVLKYAVRTTLDDERVMRDVRVEEYYDSQFKRMVYTLAKDVRAEKLADDTYTDERIVFFPVSWWDHFKMDQLEATSPLWRWVARKHPPRYVQEKIRTTVKVERYLKYPESVIQFPDLGSAIIHETTEKWSDYTEAERGRMTLPCGCDDPGDPKPRIWFYRPTLPHWYGRMALSPVQLGGDEWCRRTLVIGWSFTGQIIVPLRACKGCVGCSDWQVWQKGHTS